MKLTDFAIKAQANAVAKSLSNGTLKFLDAEGKKLAELRFPMSWAVPEVGVFKFTKFDEAKALAEGTPVSFEACAPDGVTVVVTGSVTTNKHEKADIPIDLEGGKFYPGMRLSLGSFEHHLTVVEA